MSVMDDHKNITYTVMNMNGFMSQHIPKAAFSGRQFGPETPRCKTQKVCFWGLALAIVASVQLTVCSSTSLADDWIRSPYLLEQESPPEVEGMSLAAGFEKRLNLEIETKPVAIDSAPTEVPPAPDDIQLSNYLNADGAPPPSLTDGLIKRLTDIEKKLRSRDEADAKKESTFPTHRITGFLQLDTGYYAQTHKNVDTVGEGQDGTGFRRARFAVQGKVAEFTTYQLEVDFATAGRPSFFDNYVEQGNLPFLGEVRAGQYLQPFSVDAMSGFRNLPFLERSLPFLAFVPFRRVGIMASNQTDDEMTHWAYSLFRTGGFLNAPLGDSQFATDTGNIGGYSFSTRVTQLLYYDEFAEDRYLWHVGASYDFSQLSANNALGLISGLNGNHGTSVPFYQSKVLPEFGPLGYPQLPQTFGPSGTSALNGTPLFLDTGKYQANNFQLFGLETVYQSGAFSLQSEYMGTIVDSVVGAVCYQGAYVEAMYRLTGEHRLYDKKLAALRNPVPFADFIPLKRDGIYGWGAWEIAARWSAVDLRNPGKLQGHYFNSTTGAFNSAGAANVAGNGTLNDVTLGLSWFMNAHTKVQFNWIHAMLDNTAKGYSNADLFVSRVQVDF